MKKELYLCSGFFLDKENGIFALWLSFCRSSNAQFGKSESFRETIAGSMTPELGHHVLHTRISLLWLHPAGFSLSDSLQRYLSFNLRFCVNYPKDLTEGNLQIYYLFSRVYVSLICVKSVRAISNHARAQPFRYAKKGGKVLKGTTKL